MDLTISYKPNPLLFSNSHLSSPLNPLLFNRRGPTKLSRQGGAFRPLAASAPNGPDGFSWQSLARSVRTGSDRFWSKFGESVKKETGVDLGVGNELAGRVGEGLKAGGDELERLRSGVLAEFVNWNKLEYWKDYKAWDATRIATLVLYIFVAAMSSRGLYSAIRAPFISRQRQELTEAYMEALIPEPTPTNVRNLKKGMWRKTMPKGLKMKKFIERPDGTVIHDSSFVGEDAWDDDSERTEENVNKILESDAKLNIEQKSELEKAVGIKGEIQGGGDTWRERLKKWNEIIEKEKFSDKAESANARYALEFDMKEVENSLRKDVVEKASETRGVRALWIEKRWWLYRPMLPYTYFLQKLDSSEVDAVVFTEDLRRVYVTMKEGFPLEYIVDIPLDPHLFETITSSGVEVGVIHKTYMHYLWKLVIALLPGILIIWLLRQTTLVLLVASRRYLYKRWNQLYDSVYSEDFIMPIGDFGETKAMHKEIVLGGDVWDLLDELMIYMGNPLRYYEKKVKFVRGVLLSGPPGTGKTLFARTLAKESGLPFVFASGAEFTDGEDGGIAKINRMFSKARQNAPAFVFVDEIDAIAGRNARKDPRSRATFDALLAQLDGEKEKVGIDRFSLRQAVIFICATNRPDELDPEFVRPGRIDRRVYVGLPDTKQRIEIFGVHSKGRQLAEDVDFGKLVFRTVGFSGADIRNLVNEAAIMSVRKGHPKICQQDLVDVLDKQLLEGMGVLLTEEEQQKCETSVSLEKKRLLAVHEAGHIVLAHLFPQYDWHAFSQLLPGGKETAISVFHPHENMMDQGYTTFGYLMMQMVVAHGGRCAERIVYGDDITDGGSDDLEKITKLAREMVISPQNRRLGLLPLTKRIGFKLTNQSDGPDADLIRYRWDDPRVIPNKMTPEVSEMFTRELTRYIEETEELAINALKKNRHILDKITLELLQNSRVTGVAVGEMMKGLSPVMFEDFVKPFQISPEEDEPTPRNDCLRYQTVDLYPAPLHRC